MAICSLEYLARPGLLSDSALSSWLVSRTSHRWFNLPVFRYTLGLLLSYPRILALVTLRLACVIAFLAGPPPVRAVTAAIIAVSSVLLAARAPFGTDGADQLLYMTFTAFALAYGLGTDRARQLVLWFLAAEVALAYFTAGTAKIISRTWRSGDALPGIFATTVYGDEWVGRLLAGKRRLGLMLGWSVILLECTFPLALAGIMPLTYVLLSLGAGFHIGAAVFMRLNTFLWAFLATYPAVLYCALTITHG